MTSTQIPQPDPDKALPLRVKLYSPGQIGAGAFLGSFLAAGWLARSNLMALGKPRRANGAFALGVVLTMGMLALALVLPANLPGPVLVFPQIAAVIAASKSEFGAVLAQNDKRSGWGVFGIGMGALVAICALLVALVLLFPSAFGDAQ